MSVAIQATADQLPFELLERIFQLLMENSYDMYETAVLNRKRLVHTLFTCTVVCRAWVQPALQLLYKSVTLPMFDPLGRDSVLRGLSLHGDLVRELNIEDVPTWYRMPTPPDEQMSPEEIIFAAIALCPRVRVFHVDLRTYLRPQMFEALRSHLRSLASLEDLEIVCKERSEEAGNQEDRVHLTPSHIHQLVFAVPTLRTFFCTPVAPGRSDNVGSHPLQRLSIFGVEFGSDLRTLCAPFSRLKDLHLRLVGEAVLVTQEDLAELLLLLKTSLEAFSFTCKSHIVAPLGAENDGELPVQRCLQHLQAIRSFEFNLTVTTDTESDYLFDSHIFIYIPPHLQRLRILVDRLAPDVLFDFLSTLPGRRFRINIAVVRMWPWTVPGSAGQQLGHICRSRGWTFNVQESYRIYPGLITVQT